MFVAAVVGIPSAAQFEKIDKISDKIVASTIIWENSDNNFRPHPE